MKQSTLSSYNSSFSRDFNKKLSAAPTFSVIPNFCWRLHIQFLEGEKHKVNFKQKYFANSLFMKLMSLRTTVPDSLTTAKNVLFSNGDESEEERVFYPGCLEWVVLCDVFRIIRPDSND